VAVALERERRVFLPEPDLSANPGDKLLVLSAREVTDAVLAKVS
jgi:trk system potassium uptake protein TrkA